MKTFLSLLALTLAWGGSEAVATNAWQKKLAPPKINPPVVHHNTPVVNNRAIQDLIADKLNASVQKRKGKLNDLAIFSKDPSFNFLAASAPFNRDLLESMRKFFNLKDFSAGEKDFIFITNHNQSLDDLIRNKKVVVRFGALRVIELQKNRGISSDIRVFTTAGAAGKYRSGIFKNLAILSALKPIAGAKDYLSQKGDCGTKNPAPNQDNRYAGQLNRQGQYMDGETVSSGKPANPDLITGASQGPAMGGKTYENFHGTGVSETWSSETRPDGGTVDTLEHAEYDFSDEPAVIEGSPGGQKETKEEDKKAEPAKDPAPDPAPEPAPEPEPEDAVTDLDDVTPREDSGGGNLYSFCNGLAGSMARQQCRKQIRERIFGSNDPLVLKEDSSSEHNPGYRFEGHSLQSRSTYDSHVGFYDPYIIPTEEGGRGSHSSIGVDGCGGALQRGRTIDNQFCYRVSGEGSARCDGGSGTVPGGPTRDTPIPTPGPGPQPKR